jgi:nucleoside-diphosphate-sugar epimerase
MNILIIGGTGLISTGVVKHLLARGAQVTMFNRNQSQNRLPGQVQQIIGDRTKFDAFEAQFKNARYDVVIDMVAYHPHAIESAVRAFAGKCEQYILCSTVCTYGVKIPGTVLTDETFPQEPISNYGKDKLNCERLILAAHADGKFKGTIIRPSSTYGPGGTLIDNLEPNPVAWDRIEKGLPILCGGDGQTLHVMTHRDDVGKMFAYSALNPKTYGQAYNAARDRIWTWREQLAETAAALGKKAKVIFMPSEWICAHDPARFGLLKEIMQYHVAYSSEKAKRDVPEFKCEIEYRQGAAQTLDDQRKRGKWKSCEGDGLYQSMIDKAMSIGVEPVEL